MVKILVIGAGAVGLSTAVCMQRSIDGANMTIFAEKFGVDTTSDGAAGIFRPLPPDIPDDMIRPWLAESWKYYDSIASSGEGSIAGVFPVSGYDLYPEKSPIPPAYRDYVYHYRPCTKRELQVQFNNKYKAGFFISTLMVEGRKYLPWLTKQFLGEGGKIQAIKVKSLADIDSSFDVIVNCSGSGSFELVDDKNMYPIQGQLTRVKADWVKHFYYDVENSTYIVPGANNVVLGGTKVVGDASTVANSETREQVFTRCCQLLPSLKEATFLWDWVGIRPGRVINPRVEAGIETINHKRRMVVHNYGHAADGVALSWGTAVQATKLLKQLLNEQTSIVCAKL
ncbi:unnamed protein product [Owenia fusiformis]|uniref:Uncharacterized protein n=1 Tax=Owenia fusiformis TaxID=6347 RepID=A0A8J1XJG1_OWEFU|nr:unnamed protein product [Owenia fusiformis]